MKLWKQCLDCLKNTVSEQAWLDDKENLPMWAGGKLPFDKNIK